MEIAGELTMFHDVHCTKLHQYTKGVNQSQVPYTMKELETTKAVVLQVCMQHEKSGRLSCCLAALSNCIL